MLSDTKKEQITESLLSPSGGPENTARTAATTGRDAPDDIAPVKAADLNPKAIPAEAPKKDVSRAKEVKNDAAPAIIEKEDPELIAAQQAAARMRPKALLKRALEISKSMF